MLPSRSSCLAARRPIPGLGPEGRAVGADQRGFTLLEVGLVIVIISLLVTLALPRLRNTGRLSLQSQAHRLQLVFRLLRSEAVLSGAAYQLWFDLDRQRYWVVPDQGGSRANLGALANPYQMESPVEILDVDLPMVAGKVVAGQVFTVFNPDGTVDPTLIHLGAGDLAYTLYAFPVNGRLIAAPGYAGGAHAQ